MVSFRFAGVCLAGAALLFSQSTAPQTGDAVIRVSVDLVEVDALVTDSKGRHVPDLKPEDFTILEDGKPQKITQFSFVNPAPATDTGGAQLTAFTPETRTAPARTPRRQRARRGARTYIALSSCWWITSTLTPTTSARWLLCCESSRWSRYSPATSFP